VVASDHKRRNFASALPVSRSPFDAIGAAVIATNAERINKKTRLETSVTRHGRAISVVSLLYGINVIVGLARDSALATTFGASEHLDALLLGLNFVRTLSLQVALVVATAFIPVFVPLVTSNGYEALSKLTRRWLQHSLIVLLPVSLLLMFFSPFLANLLGPGLSESGRGTLSHVLAGLAPLMIILCCSGTAKAIAESSGVYVVHPILLGLMGLGLIVGVATAEPQWKVQGAVAGVVLGSGIGLAIQIILIIRHTAFYHVWRRLLSLRRFRRASDNLPLPYRTMMLLLGSSLLVLSQGLIERAYLSHLPSGSVVTFSLALSVIGVPTALLLPAISSVLLPHLVRQENTSPKKYGLSLKQYAVLVGIFAVVTCLFWLFSDLLTEILFFRGRFSAEAAALTSQTMRWISLAFITYVLGTVLRQVLIARHLIVVDFSITGVILCVEILLLYVLVPMLGSRGVALEMLVTSFLYVVLCLVALRFASSNLHAPASSERL
jgi:putative peptidoglycan lipid II flippase